VCKKFEEMLKLLCEVGDFAFKSDLHADWGHGDIHGDGCRGSACAKIVQKISCSATVCTAKKSELIHGGPHHILPLNVVPGDGIGTWTGFKKDYP
jgi:hypothetical protein